MGSDSDWSVMEAAVEALDEFGIPCEVEVLSAHRTPDAMIAYGRAPPARAAPRHHRWSRRRITDCP